MIEVLVAMASILKRQMGVSSSDCDEDGWGVGESRDYPKEGCWTVAEVASVR